MRLTLPLPPSPNRSGGSWVAVRSNKNNYRLECWAAAVKQWVPFVEPPEYVRVESTFYLRNKRDQDNLKASLKPVLDCLKQVQTGAVKWKGEDSRAYFVDDDPRRCTVAEPAQHIDRKRPRLELDIRVCAGIEKEKGEATR